MLQKKIQNKLNRIVKKLSIYQMADFLGEQYLKECVIGVIEAQGQPSVEMAYLLKISKQPEIKELLFTLADYLKEAHEDEIINKHYGDNPAKCSYCKILKKVKELQK